jgi:hypothetical protein
MQGYWAQPVRYLPYRLTNTTNPFDEFWRAFETYYQQISTTHSYTTITIGTNDFRGVVAHPNGNVYYAPLRATAMVRINPTKTATALAAAPAGGTNPWHGAIMSPSNDNNIYLIPYDSSTVAKYSISGNSYTTHTHGIGTGVTKFITAVAVGNTIYAMPVATTTTMLVMNTTNDTFNNIASAKSAANVSYGTPFVYGTKIYYPPGTNAGSRWRVLNTVARTFTNTATMSGLFGLATEVAGGGLAFSDCSAGGTASVWSYNTDNDTVQLLFTFSTPGLINAQVACHSQYAPDGTILVNYRLGVELKVYFTSLTSVTYSVERTDSSSSSNNASRYNLLGMRTAYKSGTQLYIRENVPNFTISGDVLGNPYQNKSYSP